MREVVFALLPGLVLLDVSGPAEAFRIAAASAPGSYRLRFVSPQPAVTSGIGLELSGLESLPRTLAPDTILVLTGIVGASIDHGAPATSELVRWLASGATRGTTLMCVCAGSVIAAKAGLLAGRECTTHHAHLEELRRVEPRARVLDNRIFVQDGPVFTSAGVTAGLDLALYLIGQQQGSRLAVEVARELVVYLRRSGTDPALSPWIAHRNHIHPAVHRAQDAVIRDPSASWSTSELAAVACTSARNLTRLFAEHAGCSPLDYVQRVRFAVAKELIGRSPMDLERIAVKAGFRSAQQLRRVWSRWEAMPPGRFRALHAAP